MVAAVYTSDLTTLIPDDVASTGNWAAIGGGASGLNIETDYFIQGVNCMSKNAFASSTKGMAEDTTNTLLSTGDLDAVYTWMTHTTPGSLDSKANGGMRVVMGSSAATYNEYYYAGNDTIDYGAPWICAVVDPENATANTGSVAHTAMDTYGVVAKLVGGPTKGAPLGIDAIRQGRSYDVTAGDSGAPATFTAAAAKNDLLANRYGQFQGVPGIAGSYTMQCRLGIGTVATAAYFEDSNANISLNDLEFVDSGFQLFEVVNAGTTCKWTNVTISAVGTNSRGNFLVTSSTLVELVTCTFNDMGAFTFDANTTATGVVFRRCDTITDGTLTDCTIDSSFNASAVSNDDLDLLTGNNWIGDGTGYAVEMPTLITANDTMGWDNTFDTSTYASVDGSTGNEVIKANVDTGITLTINVASGATPPTVHVIGGGAVDVVSGQATATVKCIDSSTGLGIEGVGVIVRAEDTGPEPFEDVVTITRVTSTATVAHTGHGFSSGNYVEIQDAVQNEYNRVKLITVVNANSYTFAVSGTPTSPATGTILATSVLIFGDTDVNGEIADTRGYASNQDISGDAKKGSSVPTYVSSPISGTVDSTNGALFTITMNSDD